ncbi:Na+/H+ antiporter subunit E [Marinospirillum alkaliphilum]|uniref:Multicomponent Na+:H+ antiporter subunit E n=1 Tax=Marinospirillum alkaliphilum DSM 21637 TaxID=1122209 RepID=A0A1K2A086_9GAMM|nr:Na+/H+ antiporter subunit E [Marinospirillum alkaliphilum]SFX79744.1 multicomponent Na+:H+ antiporter subunit E [Marinospirillum alkaliphilum DSM 21637]
MRLSPGRYYPARVVLFALLWWILTQGEVTAWWWGVPLVLMVAWVTPVLPGIPWRWHGLPLLRLIPRFLLLSARGGWEVAVLAATPRHRLNTRLVDYTWSCLPEGPAQVFMASLINLIPGTLTLRPLPDQDCLHIHILNYRPSTLTTLQRLEVDVADLYGHPVPPAIRKAL